MSLQLNIWASKMQKAIPMKFQKEKSICQNQLTGDKKAESHSSKIKDNVVLAGLSLQLELLNQLN